MEGKKCATYGGFSLLTGVREPLEKVRGGRIITQDWEFIKRVGQIEIPSPG